MRKVATKLLVLALSLAVFNAVSAMDVSATSSIAGKSLPEIAMLDPGEFNLFDRTTYDSEDAEIFAENFSSISFATKEAPRDFWAHDGKGLIFTEDEKWLKDSDGKINSQHRHARRGEKISFSSKIDGGRNHYQSFSPITEYHFFIGVGVGLELDESSIKLKVGDAILDASRYVIRVSRGDESAVEQTGIDYQISIDLPWANHTGSSFDSFIYDNKSQIEIAFDATVSQEAPTNSTTLSYYNYDYIYDISSFSTGIDSIDDTKKATVHIDSSLIIKRVDASGNPLAGAKYTVDGLRANSGSTTTNVYRYDSKGNVMVFETDERGLIVITGVPLGEYTVREIYSPEGHETSRTAITRVADWNNYGPYEHDVITFVDYPTTSSFYNYIDRFDGVVSINATTIADETAKGVIEEADGLNYNSTQIQNGFLNIQKTNSGYSWTSTAEKTGDFSYDEDRRAYIAKLSIQDLYGEEIGAKFFQINGDGDIIFHDDNGTESVYSRHEGEDCYYGLPAETQQMEVSNAICRTETGFVLIGGLGGLENGLLLGMPFRDDGNGTFVLDVEKPSFYLIIDPEKNELEEYLALIDCPPIRHLFMSRFKIGDNSYGFSGLGIRYLEKTDYAYGAFYLFRDGDNPDEKPIEDTTDITIPELLPENPQTSDAIIKSLAIAAFCITPIAITHIKLSKR